MADLTLMQLKQAYDAALEQIAAESFLDDGMSDLLFRDRLGIGNNPINSLPTEPDLDGKLRMTPQQAQMFVARYDIIDAQPDDASGFSAVALLDTETNRVVIAVRSTEINLDTPRDVATDLQIGLKGFAFDQIRSMQEFLSQVQARPEAQGKSINLIGYSLSGNVVRTIAAMNPDLISQDPGSNIVFNSTGLGNFRDPLGQNRSRDVVLQAMMTDFRNAEDNPALATNVPSTLLSLQAEAELAPALVRNDPTGNVYTNARSIFAEAYVSAKYSTSYSPFGTTAADPAFAQYFGHAMSGLLDTEIVANGGVHPPAVGLPIEGQPLIEASGLNPLHDYLNTHSLTLIADSLRLQILFKEIDPSLSLDTITGIFQGASASSADLLTQTSEGDTLEKTLDSLRTLFLGPALTPLTLPSSNDPGSFGNTANRTAFYSAITAVEAALNGHTYQVVSLVGQPVESIKGHALLPDATGTAYRYALKELNPFVVLGANYTQFHNPGDLDLYDPESGNGSLTLEYLKDRATFLEQKIEVNRSALPSVSGTLSLSHFKDNQSGYEIGLSAAPLPQIIFGNATDETISGSILFSDHLYGGDGADTINGNFGDDYIEGNEGNDVLLSGGLGNDTILGGQGDDTLDGGIGRDTLDGGLDNDIMKGGSGFDRYISRFGSDTIEDPDGDGVVELNDKVLIGGLHRVGDPDGVFHSLDGAMTFTKQGTDLAVTGSGSLTIKNFNFDTGALGIHLAKAPNTATPITLEIDFSQPFPSSTVTFTDLANLEFLNIISRPTPPLIVYALGGDDQITIEGDHNEVVFGGQGNDALVTAFGRDQLFGEDGNDLLISYQGDDELDGGIGDDELQGGLGKDHLSGGEGDDRIFGDYTLGSDADYIEGGEGNDILAGGPGDDVILGGDGNDGLAGEGVTGGGIGLDGTTGNDFLDGGDGNDGVSGLAGDDILLGGNGNDLLNGDNFKNSPFAWNPEVDGEDYLDGGAGNDELTGGGFNDILFGGEGDDKLYGDGVGYTAIPGADLLDGGTGDDELSGGQGEDTLVGGAGNDKLFGDFDDEAGAADILDGGNGDDLLQGADGDDILLGGKGKDVLLGQDNDDFLQGGEGDDELQGGQGDDFVEGEAGDDRLFGDDPNDLTVMAGNDILDGGDGNDEIQAGLGNDTVFGGEGNDRLFGDAVVKNANPSNGGNDTLDGEAGDDVLVGDSGNDTLIGGTGDDYLDGGTGNDTLAGGAGNDLYVYGSFFGGIDTIDDVSRPGEGNTLFFDGGISLDFLIFAQDGDRLIIRTPFLGGNAVVLEHFDPTGANGSLVVETLQFSDGSVVPLVDFLERSGTATNFDDIIFAGAGGGIVTGGGGNDRIDARAGDHRLIGGSGNDRLMGGDGSDIYVFNEGDGVDTIADMSTATDHNTVEFGPGITATSLTLQLGSLLIRIGSGGDAIHIENFDPANPYGPHAIDTFQFADGTSLTYRQLIDRGFDLTGTNGDDAITGTGATDRITGGTGNDRLVGHGGTDTYIFDPGWGQDRILDRDITPGNVDVVRFGAGVNKDDVRVRHEGEDLRVFVRATSDQLVIENYFANNSAGYQIEQFRFADGTVWDTSIIQGMVTGGTQDDDFLYGTDGPNTLDGLAGDDQIYGFGGDDTLFGGFNEDILDGGDGNDRLYGGFGVDTLFGGLGNDVYVFGRLSGDDTVVDADATSGNLDTILLDADVIPSDAVVRQTGKGDLVLRFQSQRLTVKGWGLNDGNKVEQIQFGDGTIWDTATIKARTLQGTVDADDLVGYETNDALTGNSGNDRLFGGLGDDVLDGGAGDDKLVGGKLTIGNMPKITLFFGGTGGQLNLGPSDTFSGEGNDTYLFGAGSGQDTVFDHDLTAGNLDIIQLGAGLDPTNVTVRRMGSSQQDLTLTYILNGDSITVDNWFDSDADKVEQIRFADGTLWGIEQIRLRTLVGSPGDDTLFGFDTSDVITGDTGNDVIDAGTGDDTVTGGDQNDVISGGLGNDSLDGGFDNDTLDGGTGNDTLIGGAGNDTLLGGNGSDTYRFEVEFGRDVIIDVDTAATEVSRIVFGPTAAVGDIDRIVFGSTVLPGDVSIRRSDDNLLVRLPNTEDQITVRDWFTNEEKSHQVELIQFADGTTWNVETIKRLAIQGTAGDDTLIGYTSADILNGGLGNDQLIGGKGNDTYVFGPGYGQDTVIDRDVTAGNVDRITIQAGMLPSDLTFRRGGNDLFFKVNGTTDQLRVVDWFTTDGKVERVEFADGTVLAPADINALILQATDTDDEIIGTDENDVIAGGGGNDFIDGALGDDSLYGDNGFDGILGGDGNDLLVGGADDDSLVGGFGNDHLIGGTGSDSLNGEEGDDMLEGNDGQDYLFGGSGRDVLDGGSENDSLNGSAGADIYHIYHGGGFDRILDLSESVNSEASVPPSEDNTVIFGPGISPDDLSVQADSGAIVIGLSNDPCLENDEGVLIGITNQSGGEGAGLYASAIAQFIFDDGLVLNFDDILAKADDGAIGTQYGSDDSDRLRGSVANDQLYGFGGNDRLDARGNADYVDAGEGDDVISAGSGQDTVYGGAGQDIIAGGIGEDVLHGGAGSDVYAFNQGDGSDTIVDDAESPTASDIDTLSLSHGLTPSTITGYVDATTGELVLQAGGNDQLRISWFDPSNGLTQIETLQIERAQFIDGATVRVFDLAGIVNSLSVALRTADAGTAISLFTPATASFELTSSLAAGGAEVAAYASWCDLFDVGATLVGGDEDNSFDGTPLSDTIHAGGGNDFIQTGEGDDLVTTGGGQDGIMTGGGNDTVTSGGGDDIVVLGADHDTVTGGAGSDVLFGEGGDDTYYFHVGDGIDTIVDVSEVGAGNNICFGPGISLPDLRLAVEDGTLVLHVGTGGDAIRLPGFDPQNPFGSQTVDRFSFDGGIEIPFSQLLTSGITITGTDGVNTITGTSATDFIEAQGGDDVIQGGKGNDILNGGSGNDTYVFNVGDGIDIITDEVAPANENCIRFGPGITLADVQVVKEPGNIVINVGTNGDALILRGFDPTGATGSLVVQTLKFADGSQRNVQDLLPADSHAPAVANPLADQTRLEDILYQFLVPGDTFSDTDLGDTLTYGASLANGNALPAWLSFNPLTRTFSGTPDDINVGVIDLTVTATNSAQLSASDTFQLTVLNVNESPIVVNPLTDQTISEDTAFTMTVLNTTFTDEDFIHGDQLTYSASQDNGYALPSWLIFNPTTRTFAGTPQNSHVGNLTLSVKATDTGGLGATDTFALSILNVNDAPTVAAPITDQTRLEDVPFTFQIPDTIFTDQDVGDQLTYSASLTDGNALPSWLSFSAGTLTFSGTADDAQVGHFDLRVTATDGGQLSAFDTFSLTMVNVNEAPTVAHPLPNQHGTEDSLFNFVVPSNSFTDEDLILGDQLIYSASLAGGNALPSWLSFNPTTRLLSGTPGHGNLGSLNLTVTVTDTGGLSATDTFALSILNLNHAPTVVKPIDICPAVAEDCPFSFALPDHIFDDPDLVVGDRLTLTASLPQGSPLPPWMSFDPITQTFSGAPAEGSAGTLDVVITATDTGNLSATQTFTLHISGPLPRNIVGTSGNDTLIGGRGDDTLSGGAGSDQLDGLAGDDTLNGGTGADIMIGRTGNDIYIVDNARDVMPELAGEGTDTAKSSITYTLSANVENLTLTGTAAINGTGNVLDNVVLGNSSANTLTGGAGNDTLNGGAGADTLVGGTGNDTYVVDNTSDVVTELTNEGTDTVQSSVTYTLAANVENLTLTGATVINSTGNTLDNVLTGNNAANTLTGGGGNDTLNGGNGNDTMIGGTGDDTYVVNATGDIVTESVNEGTDIVQSSVTTTLATNVENLTLTGTSGINGTGNTLDNVLTGNNGNNQLTGGAGNDTLDGGTGNDTMVGGTGNDTFVVTASGDVVTENANEGTDTVQSNLTYTLGANVENLTLTGTTAINGTGNTLDNQVIGNSAANTLSGANGADTLRGGQGNDTVNGGSGNDTFQFGRGEGQDLVQDNSGSDKILYDAGINPLDLVISRQANDLRLSIHASMDSVTVQNWYTSSVNRAETIQAGNGQTLLSAQVDQLIQAMAGFTQQTGLTWDQAIDQQPQDVQAVLAASWQ